MQALKLRASSHRVRVPIKKNENLRIKLACINMNGVVTYFKTYFCDLSWCNWRGKYSCNAHILLAEVRNASGTPYAQALNWDVTLKLWEIKSLLLVKDWLILYMMLQVMQWPAACPKYARDKILFDNKMLQNTAFFSIITMFKNVNLY